MPWAARWIGHTLHHVDIPEVTLRNERSGEGDRLRAPLDSHDTPRRADPLGEEIETTVRPAADLDDARAAADRYLIKQPARFMRELLRLLLQPRLLRLPVAKNVLVGLGHDESSHRSRAAELKNVFLVVCCRTRRWLSTRTE